MSEDFNPFFPDALAAPSGWDALRDVTAELNKWTLENAAAIYRSHEEKPESLPPFPPLLGEILWVRTAAPFLRRRKSCIRDRREEFQLSFGGNESFTSAKRLRPYLGNIIPLSERVRQC